ncbi:MAG TPA: hypothetical protein VN969_08900 [Streptosporangiaceae bacterium]|jgi:hypothetical protein|nr:hypothetical protein [Streptosporangiaceae bacterium]
MSDMRVTMLLADHAQVADGKLFISGGGWSFCGPGPVPCSVAVLFHVPWQHTDEKMAFSLRLVDEDGHPVLQPGPRGPQPVQVDGLFEARRPPWMTPGSEIGVPMSFGSVLNLPPGRSYTWVLEVSGHTEEDWRLSFATRQASAPESGQGAVE